MARHVAALLLVALTLSASAHEVELASMERFKLFTNCEPIHLFVAIGGEAESKKIGLAKDDIEVAAEVRLRSAGIHAETPTCSRPRTR